MKLDKLCGLETMCFDVDSAGTLLTAFSISSLKSNGVRVEIHTDGSVAVHAREDADTSTDGAGRVDPATSEKGALKGTFNETGSYFYPSGWSWASRGDYHRAWEQNFNEGLQGIRGKFTEWCLRG